MYIINHVNIGGATDALLYIMQRSDNVSTKFFCRNNYLPKNRIDDLEIQIETGDSLYNLFITESYDLIHWFKVESSVLFDEHCGKIKRKNRLLPIITTVCQYPRKFKLRLTPNEIHYNQHFFIDKHVYNCVYN